MILCATYLQRVVVEVGPNLDLRIGCCQTICCRPLCTKVPINEGLAPLEARQAEAEFGVWLPKGVPLDVARRTKNEIKEAYFVAKQGLQAQFFWSSTKAPACT